MTASAPRPRHSVGARGLVGAHAETSVELRFGDLPDDRDLYGWLREHGAVGVADVVLDVTGVEPSLASVRRLGHFRLATARTRTTVHLRHESLALRRLLDAVGMSAFLPPVDEAR